mmetsp:Transcript_35957/g.83413  ORF Transcript_35957/g.83413 Transcript_35957/m.83413 type:complete len:265 (-) Transcript_35957:1277-2071(-)
MVFAPFLYGFHLNVHPCFSPSRMINAATSSLSTLPSFRPCLVTRCACSPLSAGLGSSRSSRPRRLSGFESVPIVPCECGRINGSVFGSVGITPLFSPFLHFSSLMPLGSSAGGSSSSPSGPSSSIITSSLTTSPSFFNTALGSNRQSFHIQSACAAHRNGSARISLTKSRTPARFVSTRIPGPATKVRLSRSITMYPSSTSPEYPRNTHRWPRCNPLAPSSFFTYRCASAPRGRSRSGRYRLSPNHSYGGAPSPTLFDAVLMWL